MTILYTQLRTIPDYNILCDAFTLHGQSLQNNKRLLSSLKAVVENISDKPSSNKIYKYEEYNYIFYIRITDIIISTITDLNTAPIMVESYFESIASKLADLDENKLKDEGNKCNVKNDYEEVDKELTETKKICVDNLTQMVQRGESINKMEEWGNKLKEASIGLNRTSRNMYYREKYRSYVIYIVIVMIMILLWFLMK